MQFLIRSTGGPFPEIPLGPTGRELGCYLPAGVEWRQVGYGQGEGTVEVDGREWGIYQTDGGGLAVVLHFGEIAAEEAMAFAHRVAETVTGGGRFELLLKAEDAEPLSWPTDLNKNEDPGSG